MAGKEGATIGDRTFPEGTILSVNSWVMHHSKEIWGAGAGEFRPKRWLAGERLAALDKYHMPVSIKSHSSGRIMHAFRVQKLTILLVRSWLHVVSWAEYRKD